jgi:LPXTG-motif cell wall-anchored protein
VVYCGGALLAVADSRQILRSSDDGKTWQTVLSGSDVEGGGIGEVVGNPLVPSEVYAVVNRAEVHRSVDEGVTFTRMSPPVAEVHRLSFDRLNPQTIYALGERETAWAYTLPKRADRPEALPQTGGVSGDLLPALAFGAALLLGGWRLTRRPSEG